MPAFEIIDLINWAIVVFGTFLLGWHFGVKSAYAMQKSVIKEAGQALAEIFKPKKQKVKTDE